MGTTSRRCTSMWVATSPRSWMVRGGLGATALPGCCGALRAWSTSSFGWASGSSRTTSSGELVVLDSCFDLVEAGVFGRGRTPSSRMDLPSTSMRCALRRRSWLAGSTTSGRLGGEGLGIPLTPSWVPWWSWRRWCPRRQGDLDVGAGDQGAHLSPFFCSTVHPCSRFRSRLLRWFGSSWWSRSSFPDVFVAVHLGALGMHSATHSATDGSLRGVHDGKDDLDTGSWAALVAQIVDAPTRSWRRFLVLLYALCNALWRRLPTSRLVASGTHSATHSGAFCRPFAWVPLERIQQRTLAQIAVVTVPRIFSTWPPVLRSVSSTRILRTADVPTLRASMAHTSWCGLSRPGRHWLQMAVPSFGEPCTPKPPPPPRLPLRVASCSCALAVSHVEHGRTRHWRCSAAQAAPAPRISTPRSGWR